MLASLMLLLPTVPCLCTRRLLTARSGTRSTSNHSRSRYGRDVVRTGVTRTIVTPEEETRRRTRARLRGFGRPRL